MAVNYIEYDDNWFIFPKLDFTYTTISGNIYNFSDSYVRWVLLTCFSTGFFYTQKYIFKFFIHLGKYFHKYIKPHPLPNRSCVLILGFGNNYSSLLLSEIFNELGYDLLLLNTKELINIQKLKFIKNFHNYTKAERDYNFISYEEIIEKKEILSEKIADAYIEFIFDFSTLNNNYILPLTEIDIKKNCVKIIKKKIEKKIDKNKKLNFIYFKTQKIIDNISLYINLSEIILRYMKNAKIFVFNFENILSNEFNQNIFLEMKFKLFENLQSFNNEDKKYILYVKKVKGEPQSRREAMDIFKYSEEEDYSFEFIQNFL